MSIVETNNNYFYSGFTIGAITSASISCSNNSISAKSECTLTYTNIVDLPNLSRITITSPTGVSIFSTSITITINTIPYSIVGNIVGQ